MSQRFRKPWDEAMHPDLKLKVWDRRRQPDGEEVKVRTFKRGQERVNHYPFAKMLLGDFFLVAVKGKSRNAMVVAFRQGAARNDIEISIQPHVMPDGGDGFRVIKVLDGIKAIKAKASKVRGMNIPASDGRWTARRRQHRQGERQPVDAAPVAASVPSSPAVDIGGPGLAKVGYSRERLLREAQQRARDELGLEKGEEEYHNA